MKREILEEIEELLESGNEKELLQVLLKMRPVEVAETLSELPEEILPEILDKLTIDQQAVVVADFSIDLQYKLFRKYKTRNFSKIFERLPSESRADLFQALEDEEQIKLLPFLSKRVREDVIQLSSYPPETAGGIMSTDFATVLEDMTCAEAILKVRKDAPSKRTIYYIYVVDTDMRMKGFITLKDLILQDPDTSVKEALHDEFIYADVNEDRESVAQKVEKYDLVAIPVLNKLDQLLGIVTHDEAIEVIRAEHTEDFEKFMGIVPSHQDIDYLDTTSWMHFKKRVIWIVSLAAVGVISGLIIHRFENALDKLLILAIYMPMVADTGGNAGSQAATVVVRALALGQISVGNWLKIIWKETKISSFLAVCLGLVTFIKVLFLSWETEVPETLSLSFIAIVIASALALQVISSTVIGAGLPLIVRRFGGDPAVVASPAITTFVDITGLLIYFGMATLFLSI